MYRGSSPIFDVPEFSSMRRIKPLPKRRRTSELAPQNENAIPAAPIPEVATEELIAHADSLSTQLALQSYYMPILNGVQNLFGDDSGNADSNGFDLGTRDTTYGGDGGVRDEDHGEGDYIDHLQQPGNTKKRKVPTNASMSSRGHDAGSGQSGEDEPTDRNGHDDGRPDHASPGGFSSAATSGISGQRKGRLSSATLAGLQHKEMLKQRKRQLAAVLGAISHGDTLALDQALSSNYPFTTMGPSSDPSSAQPVRVRLSKRKGPRLARLARTLNASAPSQKVPFVVSEFHFVCRSASECWSSLLTLSVEPNHNSSQLLIVSLPPKKKYRCYVLDSRQNWRDRQPKQLRRQRRPGRQY